MKRALLVVSILGAGLGMARSAFASPDDAEKIYALLEASRLDDAAPLVEKQRLAPGSGPFIVGAYAFYRGAYAEAAQTLDTALSADAILPQMVNEAKMLRDLARSTEQVTHGFVEKRSAHFAMKVAPGKDEVLLVPALDALEKALTAIGGDLDEHPPEPIRVEVYGDITDLAKVSPLTVSDIETSGTIALCKYDRLMITSPRELYAGYPWLDTLAHELTHYLVNRASHNTVPIWLHEGIAKTEETRWREPFGGQLPPSMEHLLATGLRDDHLIAFSAMHPSMAKLPSQEDAGLAFAEVTTALQKLTEGRGPSALRKLVTTLRDGGDMNRAISSVTGQSFSAFEKSWRVWLKGRGYKLHPELGIARVRFKKDGKKSDEDEEDATKTTPKSPAETRARGHVRLGTMLRNRNRLAAAAAEYERAHGLLGDGHPAFASRLGRTYLDLHEWDRAIATAQPGIVRRPDSAGLRVTVGRALIEKGDLKGGLPFLEGALSINPFDPQTRCGLAKVYETLKDARSPSERAACELLSEAKK